MASARPACSLLFAEMTLFLMQNSFRTIATLLLIATVLLSPITLPQIIAQDRERRAPAVTGQQKTWPAENDSLVRKASESKDPVQLSNEPVMRIALSTGVRAATISTTARLVNASEFGAEALPADTSRVRVESRMQSAAQPPKDLAFDLEVARSLLRDEADRMIEQVRLLTKAEGRVVPDTADRWKVVIRAQSPEEADDLTAKLEDAGFEVLLPGQATGRKGPAPVVNETKETSPSKIAASANTSKVKLISRAVAPGREVIAYSRGAAPLLRSSAPLVFASSDEATAPVRFNDTPFRGKIEVFANTRGALTVVNVIGLEDYVRASFPTSFPIRRSKL